MLIKTQTIKRPGRLAAWMRLENVMRLSVHERAGRKPNWNSGRMKYDLIYHLNLLYMIFSIVFRKQESNEIGLTPLPEGIRTIKDFFQSDEITPCLAPSLASSSVLSLPSMPLWEEFKQVWCRCAKKAIEDFQGGPEVIRKNKNDAIIDLVKTRDRSDFWLLDSNQAWLLKLEYLFPW